MKYNFDEVVNRSNNFSAKYDERKKKFGTDDLLPLWIADMDFKTAQPIIDALEERARQGIFGYTYRPDSYYEAICNWQEKRNNRTIDKSLISFSPGVVPSMSVLVRELTDSTDYVLIQTPVYSEFYDVVENWGRRVLENPLVEKEGKYTIDFQDLETKLAMRPRLFIFCNPHNPVGRVWSREELKKVVELCIKYGVTIIADEIHSDLILWGNKFTPTVHACDHAGKHIITCLAASKTFNLAGLQASIAIFPNDELKQKFDYVWKGMDILRNNCFSLVATEAAYRYGEEWLSQLILYLEKNMLFIDEYLRENIPDIKFCIPESTYLGWLDCRKLNMSQDGLNEFMIKKAKLGLNSGNTFSRSLEGFMRINAACPRVILKQALDQLRKAVEER
ncbi:MalY/PatB family protein [Aminipila terrae]|uniref:cysteine-S-conjugate beta-lyase n=1 Tax=Aminipila terrae TaxID=2697030 RepID=A0A6P1MKG3_9FIRM|nr:MalY/PatB family protein [Aminipila terrae]QHI71495.1 putative C-S lyase [Aminipila terrae]